MYLTFSSGFIRALLFSASSFSFKARSSFRRLAFSERLRFSSSSDEDELLDPLLLPEDPLPEEEEKELPDEDPLSLPEEDELLLDCFLFTTGFLTAGDCCFNGYVGLAITFVSSFL